MFRKKGWPITKIRCLCSRSSGNGSNVSKNNKRQVIGQMDYGMVPKGEKRPGNVPFLRTHKNQSYSLAYNPQE